MTEEFVKGALVAMIQDQAKTKGFIQGVGVGIAVTIGYSVGCKLVKEYNNFKQGFMDEAERDERNV